MVEAIMPGESRREEERAAAKGVATITVLGEKYRLALGMVPLGEKMAVLRETHMSFDALISDDNKVGEASVAVMVWLARRANGERSLGWQQFCETWPLGLGNDDIDVVLSTPDEDLVGDDSPES